MARLVKVAYEIVLARRQQMATLLRQEGFANIRTVCHHFGISEATARRDLAVLANEHKIKRTYGGALGDYDHRFTSFQERRAQAWDAKMAIAKRALSFLEPEGTYFFDAGSSTFAVAQSLSDKSPMPLTIVTNNLRIAEIVSRIPEIELYMTGGRFLLRQASFFGKQALNSVKCWKFDAVFIGIEGFNQEGLWNTEAEIVEFQQSVLERSSTAYFLADATKWGRKTEHSICHWERSFCLISDLSDQELTKGGLSLKTDQFIHVIPSKKGS